MTLLFFSSYKILHECHNNNKIQKMIFVKNFVFIYFFLKFFNKNISIKSTTLKKKFFLKSPIKSPNRHKKSQIKYQILNFKTLFTFCLPQSNTLVLKLKTNFLKFCFFYFSLFYFFESSLFTLFKKKFFAIGIIKL